MDCVTCQTATFVIEQLRHSGTSECKKSTKGGMPAYQRIQSPIRKRIEAGQLCPGDAVKSERELARIHQVSLMTARHALASLEREGVVERRRGIGTFVATPKIHFNKLMSYTEQMAARPAGALKNCLFGLAGCRPGDCGEAVAATYMRLSQDRARACGGR